MDRNGTVGNSSDRDQVNKVKGINEQKKGLYSRFTQTTGYRSAGARTHEPKQWPKLYTLSDRNGIRDAQRPVKGVIREFRIVRDNRTNHNAATEFLPGSLQDSSEANGHLTPNVSEKRSSENPIEDKNSPSRTPNGSTEGQTQKQCDSGLQDSNNEKSTSSDQPLLPKEERTVTHSIRTIPREDKNSEPFVSVTSLDGLYSSSLDPVHVPSSRSAGTVGAIQRAVGVVGIQRQSSDQSSGSNSNNSFSTPLLEREVSINRRMTTLRNNNPEPNNTSISLSRYFPGHHAKQQVMGHNKASQVNKEWKPKPNQNLSSGTSTHSVQGSSPALSEKPLQATSSKNEHVIIPHHLRVPESERSGIMFGSFGAGFDDSLKAPKNSEETSNQHSSSVDTPFSVGFDKDVIGDKSSLVDSLAGTSRSSHQISPAEPEHLLPLNEETRDIESYPDIELIQRHNSSSSPADCQQQQNPPNLSEYSAYDGQMGFVAPITKMMVEKDNVRGQSLSSAHEGLNCLAPNNKSLSSVSMVQQQQQQSLTQLYSQVPFSHYQSFVPYRPLISQMCIPQMVMPNYPNSSGHSHPSMGSNYLVMPGGTPQFSNSMKYGAAQYKPVQNVSPTAAYGSYTNQGGYTVTVTGSSAGLEDMSGINYKDNNAYNPQLDGDIWIQPREVATLQSIPYYNLSGQAAVPPTPHPGYMPGAQTTNPSMYPAAAFQPPHVQYPGIYQQPGSFMGPTSHVIQQQQVPPALAGNPAIGMGAYQPQPQVGNHSWSF